MSSSSTHERRVGRVPLEVSGGYGEVQVNSETDIRLD